MDTTQVAKRILESQSLELAHSMEVWYIAEMQRLQQQLQPQQKPDSTETQPQQQGARWHLIWKVSWDWSDLHTEAEKRQARQFC